MSPTFGKPNPELTNAIKRLATQGRPTETIKFRPHALTRMDERGFDHEQVMTCLRRGTAYGPELENGRLRASVVNRGLHIRVVVEGLDGMESKWNQLERITVVTVIEAN